jgi:S-adenosylmethionine uptake transporter
LWGSVAILLSACLYAYNIILMRQQAQVARPLEVAFFISGITTLAYLTAAPVLAVPPSAQHLAPVEYTSFVWAALLGWFVFGEEVSGFTLAGAALIVGACSIAASRRGPDPVAQAESGIPGGA